MTKLWYCTMQESADEVDYMSDAFLKELEDVRPGLLNREAKRKTKIKNSSEGPPQQKKVKVIENEARQKGLSLPISSDNKGFAMLQKMGYEEGMSLGKSGDGKTSLIPLVVKDGRSGLGRRKFVVKKTSQKTTQSAQKFTDFRQRKQTSLLKSKINSDLRKSRLACHKLDVACGYEAPVMEWYWPEDLVPKIEQESDSDTDDEGPEMEPSEQLEGITAYLRANHFYCIWCGTTYEDEDDIQENCPGDNEGAHE